MTISSQSNLKSGFVAAKRSIDYKSYNGQFLRTGDVVYQIKDDIQKPSLVKYKIVDCLQDGRIRITHESNGNSTTISVNPAIVHTDAQALLEHWLAIAKQSYEIDLPTRIQNLESALKTINPNWQGLVVGEDTEDII